jgi:RNA 2',3'-cyclic 3'-phosphodiesterase
VADAGPSGESATPRSAQNLSPDPALDPADGKPLRLFVALELPGEWRDALRDQSGALETAAPGFARWVAPELIHLTLVFLGPQHPSVVPRIQDAVEDTAALTGPITLAPGELGSFGSPRSLRVIWAGVSEQPRGALQALHARLTSSLQGAGVSFEASDFRPHLTLGRARRDQSGGSEAMFRAIRAGAAGALKQVGEFTCEEIVLIRSDLRPYGPIYTPLHRATFRAS